MTVAERAEPTTSPPRNHLNGWLTTHCLVICYDVSRQGDQDGLVLFPVDVTLRTPDPSKFIV